MKVGSLVFSQYPLMHGTKGLGMITELKPTSVINGKLFIGWAWVLWSETGERMRIRLDKLVLAETDIFCP
tara:strand:+ start:68 stop:277 length:210 start_codon:yes stop_codon:yes gene_type:complete